MLNILTTLFRARQAQMLEALADENALLILDQQIRDAAQALDASRRALAITTAQDRTRRIQTDGLAARIADLETRAAAALRDGATDLAMRAAEAIAEIEAERLAVEADRARFAAEAARLTGTVTTADRRLAALRRGRGTAEAAEAVRRLRTHGIGAASGPGALASAEATLARLRRTQEEAEAADQVFDELRPDDAAAAVSRSLEAAGYGPSTRPTAAAVFERLKRAAG